MEKTKITQTTADLLLVTVAIFWGSTFIISKLILEEIPLFTFLVIRLNMAAFIMLIIAFPHRNNFNKKTLLHGIILGILLFFSYVFQMWGIQYTSASNAGFITGINVVLVPIFSMIIFRDQPRKASLLGVAFATAGLYFLSGGNLDSLTKGDWLVFICAVVVTFHVIYTGKFAPQNNIYVLTAVQLLTIGVLSLAILPFQDTPLPIINMPIILILLYLALFGTTYTFLMQTSMQRFTTATRTALVFSLEPVFAALFAYIVAGETLTASGWLGGLLILCGMIIAEVKWEKYI